MHWHRAFVLSLSVAFTGIGAAVGQVSPAVPATRGSVATPTPSTPSTPVAVPRAVTSPAAASDLKIALMDGSILTGKISVGDIAIETKFGNLKIPVTEIDTFLPGLQSHPQFTEQLNKLVDDLAADAFADREKSQQALQKIGPDIKKELERQIKTAEAEKQNRLQNIIDSFESTADDDTGPARQWVKEDVIVTPGFTVVGKITTSSFAMTSQYGTLQLRLEDVRYAWRDTAEPEEIRKTLAVTGTSMSQRVWVNSGIRLNRGDQVFITASGTIGMPPWGNNQSTTPEGGTNFGQMQPGNIPGGCLIGRINDNGPIMRVGSKNNFTATTNGTLQFGMAVNGDYNGYSFPGEFQVKVRVVKKK